MQEMEKKGAVDVSFGSCDDCYVIDRGVNEAYSRHLNDRCFFCSFCRNDFVREVEDLGSAESETIVRHQND